MTPPSLAPLPPAYATPAMRQRLELIAESHRRLTGRDLVPPVADIALALWQAPVAIVAHGTEPDPIFFFGNRLALQRFEATVEQFTVMPSRLSAEPPAREQRQALLDRVRRDGWVDDYSGIRTTATGRRFRIEQALVWNLVDAAGQVHGQAASFERWTDLSDDG